jgi:citrate lyase subunit beta / citryl-CoA lyase
MTAVAPRRSWLYVPGDRPERFAKAVASGADVVICDLEDAVSAANKAIARHAVADWLRGHRAVVRVNGVGTPWHDDVAAIADAPGLAAVLLPKTDEPTPVQQLEHRLAKRIDVIPPVETAAGVANAGAIAAAPQMAAMAFGSIDFALDLGIDDNDGVDETALLYARSTLVIASRAAGIAPPIDAVHSASTSRVE